MNRVAKTVLPIIIILFGVLAAWQLMANSPKAQHKSAENLAPLVKTMKVSPQDVRIPIHTQGTVEPRTSISLAAEVSGKIVKTATQFAKGGFFRKGDVLLNIDPEEYQLAITRAEANVASAVQQLAKAEAEYKQKQEEYKNVSRDKVTDFALRKPEYEEAKAKLKAAKADLELAQLKLKRCEIRAPFDGRVTEKMADIGQYITPGMVVASLYSTDRAEIRLPITHAQTQLLDIAALTHRDVAQDALKVSIRGFYAGKQHQWQGSIVRTDAKIDDRNRLLYLIAQVDDPYGFNAVKNTQKNNEQSDNEQTEQQSDRSILAAGMFVKADIPGRMIKNIFVIPRTAIRDQNTVWLLDESLKLNIRSVNVIHRDDTSAYIDSGLQDGDVIVTSPLEAVVDGMQLRIANQSSAS